MMSMKYGILVAGLAVLGTSGALYAQGNFGLRPVGSQLEISLPQLAGQVNALNQQVAGLNQHVAELQDRVDKDEAQLKAVSTLAGDDAYNLNMYKLATDPWVKNLQDSLQSVKSSHEALKAAFETHGHSYERYSLGYTNVIIDGTSASRIFKSVNEPAKTSPPN